MSRLIALFSWLALWWLLSTVFDLKSSLLPDFWSVLRATFDLLSTPSFYNHVTATLGRLVPGLITSLIVGLPVGLILASLPTLRSFTEPLVTFVRGVPVASLFPVAILLFGIGDGARAALTIYVSLPIVITATISGAVERPENRIRRDYLRLHRRELPWTDGLLCLLWDSLPAVVGGMRVATSMALVVIIVSEMFFVGGRGLGWYAWDQYQSFNFPAMYAAILIVGLLSLALDFGLMKAAAMFSGNGARNAKPAA